jgi:hypothetical protein
MVPNEDGGVVGSHQGPERQGEYTLNSISVGAALIRAYRRDWR